MEINDLIENNHHLNIKKWGETERCAVYFVCETNGDIIYIGSTMTLDHRLYVHNRNIRFYNKLFYYLKNTKEKCQLLENELICLVRPKYNIYCNSCSKENQQTEETKNIRQKILNILNEKNINQTNLAKRMKVSRQRLSQILIDKQNLTSQTIKKIEKAIQSFTF